jgi:hypothetical protein
MNAMARLGTLWNSIQAWLFPMLEDELGALDEKRIYDRALSEAEMAVLAEAWALD